MFGDTTDIIIDHHFPDALPLDAHALAYLGDEAVERLIDQRETELRNATDALKGGDLDGRLNVDGTNACGSLL